MCCIGKYAISNIAVIDISTSLAKLKINGCRQ